MGQSQALIYYGVQILRSHGISRGRFEAQGVQFAGKIIIKGGDLRPRTFVKEGRFPHSIKENRGLWAQCSR